LDQLDRSAQIRASAVTQEAAAEARRHYASRFFGPGVHPIRYASLKRCVFTAASCEIDDAPSAARGKTLGADLNSSLTDIRTVAL
jgi:hypothetical protein